MKIEKELKKSMIKQRIKEYLLIACIIYDEKDIKN